MIPQKSFIPRAPRYQVEVELRYRPIGEILWHDGRSENVSRSGVLFHPECGLSLHTQIEVMFAMPVEMTSPAAMDVRRARIVRSIPASLNGKSLPYVAAAFEFEYVSPHDPRRI